MSLEIDLKMESHKDEVEKACAEAIEAAMTEIGIAAQLYASAEVPVDTGRLRASINYVTSTGSGEGLEPKPDESKEGDDTPKGFAEEKTVVLGTNVEYAEVIEKRGGEKGRGKHFLRNAFNNHEKDFQNILLKHLNGN